jgi:O-antigen ligase/tetratricopeptide (TPR) repeat protein
MTEKLHKIADASILIIVGFLTAATLFFPPSANPDMSLFYLGCVLAAGLIFVLSNKILKEELKIETPIDGNLLLLFAWCLLTSVTAKNILASFNSTVIFTAFLLLFYVAYNYAKKYFTQFLVFIIAASCVLSGFGIFQFAMALSTGSGGWISNFSSRFLARHAFVTLIGPGAFSGLLILVIPIVIGLIRTRKRHRYSLTAALAVLCAGLVLTRSIGAFISLIAGVFLMLLFVNDQALSRFRRLFFILLLIAAAALAAAVKLRGISVVLPELQAKLAGYLRMLDVILAYPLFGGGPGSFEAVYNNPAFGRTEHLKYASNFLIQTCVEAGIPGLLLLLYAGFSAYSAVIRNFYFLRTPYKKIMVFSLLTGITAFLIHNLVEADIYSFEICVVFVVILAALLSQVNIGLIQLKKVKLAYLLGINPGRRRTLIFYIALGILALSAVTGGKQTYVLTAMNVLITAGFAVWSVSKEDIRLTSADAPLIAGLAWSTILLFITPDIYSGFGLYSLIIGAAVLYYLSSQFLRRHNYRIIISNYLASIGVIISVAAVFQYIYKLSLHAPGIPFADGFFPNQALFSAYLCVSFSMLLSKLLFEKKAGFFKTRILGLFVIALAASLSYSKSSMLALIFCLAATALFYRLSKKSMNDLKEESLRKSWVVAAAFILLLFFTFSPFTPSGQKLLNLTPDPFYFNRLGIWKAALQMGAARLFTGWGAGSFQGVFQLYNFPVNGIARFQMNTPFAHNEFLQAFAEGGIPGVLIIIWLLWSIFKRLPENEGDKKVWAARSGAYFGLAALAFHSLFYFTLHLPGILYTSAILASMITTEKSSIRTVSREALLFTKIYYLPALLLSFIIFSIAVRPAVGHYLHSRYAGANPSDRERGKYEAINSASLADPLNASYIDEKGMYFAARGNMRTSIPLFERALKFDSLNFIYSLHAARAYAGIGDRDEALRYYEHSISSSPFRAFTYIEEADYYLSSADSDPQYSIPLTADKIEELVTKSVELEPDYLEARNFMAVIYSHRNNFSGALKEYDTMDSILASKKGATEDEMRLLTVPSYATALGRAIVYMDMRDRNNSCAWYGEALKRGSKQEEGLALSKYCGDIK